MEGVVALEGQPNLELGLEIQRVDLRERARTCNLCRSRLPHVLPIAALSLY
jgi:hypothetical protein